MYNKLNNFIKNNKFIIISIMYLISPLDFIPEVVLGGFGYIDDFVVFLILVAFFVLRYTLNEIKSANKTQSKSQSKVDFEYEDAEFEEIKE